MFKKIGSYCCICDLHYGTEQKLYTANKKLYTVYSDRKFNDQTTQSYNAANITTILPNTDDIHKRVLQNHQNISSSPAQIRTGVKGSKGLYAWPLHSALIKYYRASGQIYIVCTDVINFTNLFLIHGRDVSRQFFDWILHFLYYLVCVIPNIFTFLMIK